MLKQSLGSVEVYWLDRDAVILAVKRAARLLARRHREIRRVILFGSLARGDAVPGSDADLLVVLAQSNLPFLDRVPLYHPSDVPVGVDVFPYTEQELATMVADGNYFIRRALAEGVTVLARRGSER